MIEDCQIFFSNLSKVILFINTVIYFNFFYKKTNAFKVFSIYLLYIFTIQIYSYILNLNKIENLYLSHFYFIGQFVFLTFFYRILLKKKKERKIIFFSFFLTLIILFFQYCKTPNLYYKFNLLEIVLTSLVVVTFSTIYFYNSLTEESEYTFINSGIFVYLISSTLIFCSGNILDLISTEHKNILWLTNSILFAVYQLLIFYEWYKNFSAK